MSITFVRPPPPVRVVSGREGRKWYTLHSHSNNVFAWTLEGNSMKTSTVAFARRQDASFMARLIERYVVREKEWPDVSLAEKVFRIYGSDIINSYEENGFIEIKSWSYNDLRVFCAESYLDMITLKKITKKAQTFVLSGELNSLDVPVSFYVERLNYLLGM